MYAMTRSVRVAVTPGKTALRHRSMAFKWHGEGFIYQKLKGRELVNNSKLRQSPTPGKKIISRGREKATSARKFCTYRV